ncbi:hypothetical protein LCGC14_2715270 [marine sediment metagenome]|uniref:Uncharacterized protein n=1 Tax=marine sediment metagenome TaxID=412755 RepID=A0A0F8ZZD5_9ZZZZ|nr:hypothetical protein [Desulfobacterales bacterium]
MKKKPLPHECYKGEILHFIFQLGREAYLGKWVEHPNNFDGYEGWVRIQDPCVVVQEQKRNSKGIPRNNRDGSPMTETKVKKVGEDLEFCSLIHYEDHMDFYWPMDIPLNLRILKRDGAGNTFYKLYVEEISCLHIPTGKEVKTVTDISVAKH